MRPLAVPSTWPVRLRVTADPPVPFAPRSSLGPCVGTSARASRVLNLARCTGARRNLSRVLRRREFVPAESERRRLFRALMTPCILQVGTKGGKERN